MIHQKLRYAAALVAAFVATPAASAAVLIADEFQYTPVDATLSDADGAGGFGYVGTNTSGVPTSSDPKIASGSLSHPDRLANAGNSVKTDRTASGSSKISIGGAATSGTVYYSMLVQVSDLQNLTNTTTGSFFAGFNNNTTTSAQNNATTSVATAGGGLYIHRDADNTSAYNLGVGVSTGNNDRIFDTTELTEGQTLFVVVAHEINAGTDDDNAYLWINPSPTSYGAAAAPAATVTSSAAAQNGTGTNADISQLASFFLRNNSVEPNQILLDDLRVATTWAEATALVIPEPTALAVSGFGALALLRRRARGGTRKAQSNA